jgi:CBS domain-containing protein
MLVGELCNRKAVTVGPHVDLVNAAQLMRNHHVGFLVVTEDGSDLSKPIGVLTDRDIVIEVVAEGVDPLQLNVGDAMSREPLVMGADARPEHALAQMRAFGVRRTPVVDTKGLLTGVLALDDLLEWLAGALSDAAGLVHHEQRIERQLRA